MQARKDGGQKRRSARSRLIHSPRWNAAARNSSPLCPCAPWWGGRGVSRTASTRATRPWDQAWARGGVADALNAVTKAVRTADHVKMARPATWALGNATLPSKSHADSGTPDPARVVQRHEREHLPGKPGLRPRLRGLVGRWGWRGPGKDFAEIRCVGCAFNRERTEAGGECPGGGEREVALARSFGGQGNGGTVLLPRSTARRPRVHYTLVRRGDSSARVPSRQRGELRSSG